MMTIEWCSVCNSRPADGMLTILVNEQEVEIPACAKCVDDPKRVEFING